MDAPPPFGISLRSRLIDLARRALAAAPRIAHRHGELARARGGSLYIAKAAAPRTVEALAGAVQIRRRIAQRVVVRIAISHADTARLRRIWRTVAVRRVATDRWRGVDTAGGRRGCRGSAQSVRDCYRARQATNPVNGATRGRTRPCCASGPRISDRGCAARNSSAECDRAVWMARATSAANRNRRGGGR